MSEIQLISIWKAPKCRDTYVNSHAHKYHELVYYIHGKGKTIIDGNGYAFCDNNFAVIPPYIRHDEKHFSDAEIICIEFSGEITLPQGVHVDTLGLISKILKEILEEAQYQYYGYKDMIAAKLIELCLRLIRVEKCDPLEKNFEYIMNYLKENYHDKIILSNCAKQLNISYDYFQHKFKKITGNSPQQFLIKQRLNASEKMLRAGKVNCNDIAYLCGFSTAAQFSALFKKEFGKTPLQYKKANSGN